MKVHECHGKHRKSSWRISLRTYRLFMLREDPQGMHTTQHHHFDALCNLRLRRNDLRLICLARTHSSQESQDSGGESWSTEHEMKWKNKEEEYSEKKVMEMKQGAKVRLTHQGTDPSCQRLRNWQASDHCCYRPQPQSLLLACEAFESPLSTDYLQSQLQWGEKWDEDQRQVFLRKEKAGTVKEPDILISSSDRDRELERG